LGTKDNLDDFAGAMDDYDMAIKLNPEYVEAHNNRGIAKKVLGKHEEAEADFAKAKELNLNKK
jgi:tetratricopeptide (TPR) repeat protein